MAVTDPRIDDYIQKNRRWQSELTQLRKITLQSELIETLKWGVPCYTLNNANVVLLHCFKDYCAILFVKGALLGDPARLLIHQTENVQAGRQIRFTNVTEILTQESVLTAYLAEAIDLEKAGAKVAFKKTTEFTVPAEFQAELDADPELQTAFKSLTPGRQRAYLLFFGGAKQSTTRQARIEKYRASILAGKGLDD